MKILNLNNLMRNLTLIGAGAFMATLVVLPITTSAEDDDDINTPVAVPAATYTLGASDGTSAVFTLPLDPSRSGADPVCVYRLRPHRVRW